MADLELEQIKGWFDQDYTSGQTNRIAAADDRLFCAVTQWDSGLLADSQLSYKGEFDLLRKARREIKADLRQNPVQINFEPTADSREVDADLLDGLYLSDDRRNTSLEAYSNAESETVDCGMGAWELFTEWESNRAGDRNQVIRRRPLYEANNNAFPDCNAKLLDKSDAKRWTILVPYSKEGYQALHEELTGEETDAVPANFASPEQSYVFPWVIGTELYYIARFYHRTLVKDEVITFADPFGQRLKLRASDLEGRGEDGDIELWDELETLGYSEVSRKKIKRWEVKLYILSGEKILSVRRVAGEWIPVVPMYGERTFIEGEEIYEGIVRAAKDPQRLRNFLFSYLGDMVSRSPREKPIFGAPQVAGYENMYSITGAENNYPYVLQNLKGPNGEDLPLGPVGTLNAPQIPQALTVLVDLSRQATEDVASSVLPKNFEDIDLSGEAVEKLTARLDSQSQIYQENRKHAKRFDAVIYASMAAEVYDAPRRVTLTLPDGSRKVEQIMSTVIDKETGEPVVMNDLTNAEFDVYADVGPSYTSKREKTMDELGQLADQIGGTDPALQKIILLKRLTLTDGFDTRDIKEYARSQLLLMGAVKPQDEEEEAFLAQAMNQPEKPDPEMLYAQASMVDAQSKLVREQREAKNDEAERQIDVGKLRIDKFNADTQRMKVNIERSNAGLTGHLTKEKIVGQRVSNRNAALQPFMARVNA